MFESDGKNEILNVDITYITTKRYDSVHRIIEREINTTILIKSLYRTIIKELIQGIN